MLEECNFGYLGKPRRNRLGEMYLLAVSIAITLVRWEMPCTLPLRNLVMLLHLEKEKKGRWNSIMEIQIWEDALPLPSLARSGCGEIVAIEFFGTVLRFFGFGVGFAFGLVIGYFLFIFSQPTDVKLDLTHLQQSLLFDLLQFKFISELDLETKALLEAALMEGNRERELKILKATKQSLTYNDISEDHDAELYLICFYRDCNMEVQDCKHQMCAHCILALCCYGKSNLTTLCLPSPVCPFCPATFQSW
ncbi:hypothetical protein ZIOFF_012912 [Zingiber officinale]|uniref:RING-type E3 ubiquitin transferase n=1 Tax=Zingiber officinale TaxID=94328 RepID=A0A8J5HQ03_ZINOF|nr:hypothetical protein ZIOFF_012912 [Zingiber officinale]